MGLSLSVIAIYAWGALGIGLVAVGYKMHIKNQSRRKRVQRLRARLEA